MARSFRDLEAKMLPERLAAAKAMAQAHLEQSVLNELRRRAGWTPAAIAAELGMDADTYVELQGADDMPLSTLQRLVRSLGGELDVVVRLPDRTVSLNELTASTTRPRPAGPDRVPAETATAAIG